LPLPKKSTGGGGKNDCGLEEAQLGLGKPISYLGFPRDERKVELFPLGKISPKRGAAKQNEAKQPMCCFCFFLSFFLGYILHFFLVARFEIYSN